MKVYIGNLLVAMNGSELRATTTVLAADEADAARRVRLDGEANGLRVLDARMSLLPEEVLLGDERVLDHILPSLPADLEMNAIQRRRFEGQ
jgi:hypothetical protein